MASLPATIHQVLTLLLYLSSVTGQYNIPEFFAEEQKCPQSGDRMLPVIQVPWNTPYRAYMTIPPEVELVKSVIPEAGLGIRARSFILKYTWLAEYEGEVITQSKLITEYAFRIPRQEDVRHYVDAYNVQTSSWVRWVNCARNSREENVEPDYCAGKVYYRTMKDIAPGQELLVYYGDDYARILDITYRLEQE